MTDRSRGPGLSAFSRTQIASAQYASHGQTLRAAHDDSLKTQLAVFQSLLHNFSVTHAKEIRGNPTFRAEFARMCNAIGVDPLSTSVAANSSAAATGSSSKKSRLNDFYFELAVRVVELCKATRAENGGLMSVSDIRRRLALRQTTTIPTSSVSEDDVLRAVESLAPLQSGFSVTKIGSKHMVRSVAKELNGDQSVVLEAIQVLGYVTVSMIQLNLRWNRARAVAVIDDLVADSLVWKDAQAEEIQYWSPSTIGSSLNYD